ncbi:MAG: hypothetical protein Q8N84_03575 [bacterium]|nr:hypothetical protein [bacterium]
MPFLTTPRRFYKKLARSCIISSTFFLLSGMLAISALAGQTGLQISPLAIEKELSPGESVTATVKIFNPFTEPQVIRLLAKDAVPSNSQGGLEFLDYSQGRFSLTRWLDFPKDNFRLEPLQEIKVKVDIDVPKNALAGTHTAAIFATPLGSNSQLLFQGFTIQQKVAVGTIFLIKVRGVTENLEPYGGEIESFEITNLRKIGPYQILTEPPKFSLMFKNTGIFHQIVWGGLEISDSSGKVRFISHLPEHRILPTARSLFQESWTDSGILGSYKAKATIIFGEKGEKQTAREQSFLYINPKACFIFLIGATIALVFLNKRLRHQS